MQKVKTLLTQTTPPPPTTTKFAVPHSLIRRRPCFLLTWSSNGPLLHCFLAAFSSDCGHPFILDFYSTILGEFGGLKTKPVWPVYESAKVRIYNIGIFTEKGVSGGVNGRGLGNDDLDVSFMFLNSVFNLISTFSS